VCPGGPDLGDADGNRVWNAYAKVAYAFGCSRKPLKLCRKYPALLSNS
jgi:hypothetical protein